MDVNTISLEELRKLADEEMSEGQPNDKPRDEKGRFVSAEPETEEQDLEQEEVPVIYKTEIDLGDGSGVQVFKADSQEELIQKLADAQKHATKKIRELTKMLKPQPVEVPKPKQYSKEEKDLLTVRMATDPAETIAELVNQEIARREAENIARVTAENAAVESFMSRNPDYVANQNNGQRLLNYLKTYRLDTTVDNLEKAFTDLSASGLLVTKQSDAEVPEQGVTENDEPAVATSGIQKPVAVHKVTEPVKKAASGLPVRGRSTSRPAKSQEPTIEELYKMPLHELKRLANKSQG